MRRESNGNKYNQPPNSQDNQIAEEMTAQTPHNNIAKRIIRVSEGFGELSETSSSDGLSLKIFGLELSKFRRRRGLSLEELAEKSDVDADTLFAIELGILPLDLVTINLHPIGNALGDYQYLNHLLQMMIRDC